MAALGSGGRERKFFFFFLSRPPTLALPHFCAPRKKERLIADYFAHSEGSVKTKQVIKGPCHIPSETNHSLHATQIFPVIVKVRAINVEGNKRLPA